MRISVPDRRRGFSPASMSDIAFLLIIFLLVTVSIDDSGEIKLPKFRYAKESVVEEPIALSLDPAGILLLEGREVPLEGLEPALRARLRTAGIAPEQAILHLQADEARPFKQVNDVLAAIDGAGVKRIVLIAEQREQ